MSHAATLHTVCCLKRHLTLSLVHCCIRFAGLSRWVTVAGKQQQLVHNGCSRYPIITLHCLMGIGNIDLQCTLSSGQLETQTFLCLSAPEICSYLPTHANVPERWQLIGTFPRCNPHGKRVTIELKKRLRAALRPPWSHLALDRAASAVVRRRDRRISMLPDV